VDRYRRTTGRQIHFARGFWTGPLDPQQAWHLEKTQIQALDLQAVVSLTDHDDISASAEIPEAPVSCEWTVPFRGAILHLGVHNLLRADAADWMSAMNAFTSSPEEEKLRELLDAFDAMPATLVVLNHPLWALNGDSLRHCVAMLDFLRGHRQFLHALEWNGIRPDRENAEVFRLARELEIPVVSGGDRHGCEPNAVLNLTAEADFDSFIAEVRHGRRSVRFGVGRSIRRLSAGAPRVDGRSDDCTAGRVTGAGMMSCITPARSSSGGTTLEVILQRKLQVSRS
jgi:hypothetical protein